MAARKDTQAVRDAVAARLGEAQKLLCELVSTPSPPGREQPAAALAERAFAPLAEVRRLEMTNELKRDPDYQDSLPDLDYEGRCNLVAAFRPRPGGKRRPRPPARTLILNTHLDCVPPGEGQPDPFLPALREGAIYGRGACDAKGQVATIWLAMAALRDMGVEPAGRLVAHLVVEEELGGNGALAIARSGERGDACVVLEPTGLKVLTSMRGAVWFRITLRGRPGHSGSAAATRNAIDMAIRAAEVLRGCHSRLLEASRGEPLFDRHPNPMPLTLGSLHAGDWPSIAPGQAVLQGVMGFLPNRTARQVMDEITSLLNSEGGKLLAGNFDIRFPFRHDASVVPVNHPLAASLQAAARAAGCQAPIDAMTASCDAVFYNNMMGIPTVAFGGGSLSVAHSNTEHMPISELAAAAEAIARLAVSWCGYH